ncbi:MAG: helix-turn-helix transcriptional regulator [Lachnospiraceae bacterium]
MENSKSNKTDTNKAERQIYILSLLSENPKGFLVDEIRERLKAWDIEVARRTIVRDIDELSVNYGICEEERNGKTYYYADKYTLRNVDLTIEDLASLAFAREILSGYTGYNMGRHAVSLLEKMVDTSTTFNKKQFDTLCGHFKQIGGKASGDNVDSNIEHKIQNAIDNQNKVSIDYYSFSSDETTKRVIHPYQLLVVDGYLSVEGYCELRNEVRRFRLSRMNAIEVLDEKFETEELQKFAPSKTFLKLTGGNEEEMELVFTGDSIRYVKEYDASLAKRIEEKEDGLHFFQKTAIGGDVIRWVRGYGPEVKVVKPEWLAEQLVKESKMRLDENGMKM